MHYRSGRCRERPLKGRTAVRLLTISFALATACGSDDSATTTRPSAEVSVDLVVDGGGIRITRVYPAADFPIAKFKNYGSTLRYELRDAGGALVVSGEVPDWRLAFSEGMTDGSMWRSDQRLEFGAGSIRLPSVPGTLVLREKSTGVELGRADFAPITTTRGTAVNLRDHGPVLGVPYDGDDRDSAGSHFAGGRR